MLWHLQIGHSLEGEKLLVIFLSHFNLNSLSIGEHLENVCRLTASIRVNHRESGFGTKIQLIQIGLFRIQSQKARVQLWARIFNSLCVGRDRRVLIFNQNHLLIPLAGCRLLLLTWAIHRRSH